MACVQKYFLSDDEIFSTDKFDISEFEKGISLYEVVKIINAKALFLEEHILRLKKSAYLKGLNIWLSDKELIRRIYKIIEYNEVKYGRLKFIFRFYENQNKFFSFFIELIDPEPELYKRGAKIITIQAKRSSPNVKAINYNLRRSIKEKLKQQNAIEALLICKNGRITEGSKSNFFLIKDNKIYTAFTENVLPGITRDYVFRICKKHNIEIIEQDIYIENLKEFDSAFITGTSLGILPVKKIDNIELSLGNGIIMTLRFEYEKYLEDYFLG